MSAAVVAARSPSHAVRVGRGLIVGALALAFALRLAFAFGYWVGKPLTLDEREYLQLGASVASGRGLRYGTADTSRHFERPPGFAAFVAAVMSISGGPSDTSPVPASSSEVPPPLKVAQSLLGVLGVGLMAAVAAQAAGRAAGIATAFLAAIYPPLAWICGYVLAEPLYSALALGVVWLLNEADRPRAADSQGGAPTGANGGGPPRLFRFVLLAGVAAGAAVLTKEAMVFFVPLAVAWLAARRRVLAALAFCAAFGLVLTPWVVHNYTLYGRFVLTAPHGGVTFWTGNNPLSPGEGDLAANPEMGRARVAFEQRHAGLDAQELDSAYYQEAFRFIREQPLRWLTLLARKAFFTFAPIGPSYRLHSVLYFGASLASYACVFAFGLAGLWRLARVGRLRNAWALWLLAASTVLMSLVFFPQERFRIPVLDPALVVAAGAWLGSLRKPALSFGSLV